MMRVLITGLLALCFNALSLPAFAIEENKWTLSIDKFSTDYAKRWTKAGVNIYEGTVEEAGVAVVLSSECDSWTITVGAFEKEAKSLDLKVRINNLMVHTSDPDTDTEKKGMAFLIWTLSEDEEISIREGGYIYVKIQSRATVKIPLETAAEHMDAIDAACKAEEDVWD